MEKKGLRLYDMEFAQNRPISPPTATSQSLLARARIQDPAAWRRLTELYAPLVYGWCRRWGLQRTDAQDVVQEVFRAVAISMQAFRKSRPQDTFRGWLWTIARNEAHEFFARMNRRPQAVGGTAVQLWLAEIPACHPQETEGSGPDDETAQLVRRAMDVMRGDFEERTWRAFLRTTVDLQSAPVVAAELGMTPRAVRQAKHRVLQRLREEFQDLIE